MLNSFFNIQTVFVIPIADLIGNLEIFEGDVEGDLDCDNFCGDVECF